MNFFPYLEDKLGYDTLQSPLSKFNHTSPFSYGFPKRNSCATNTTTSSSLDFEEALSGTLGDQSPTLIITDVLDTLMPEVEALESPVAEEDEEGSSSTLGNNTNEGDDTDGEE